MSSDAERWMACAVKPVVAARLCGLLMSAAAVAAAGEAIERQAVIDTMQSWEEAVENGDYETLERYYMQDAIYYPHETAPIVGRDAIIERNRQRGASSRVDITQKVDDLRIHHDWAIYSCLARIRIAGDADDEAVRHVRVLLVMQKDVDGQWKILRDIDNGTPQTF